MKKFMNEEVFLTTHTSKKLFHDYAAKAPIVEYNSSISAKDIFQRRTFDNLTKLWIENDPVKQQAMLQCGVDERFVTGVASDYDKFLKFAEIMPKLIGSAVYHLAHMELQKCFGIHTPLDGKTAPEIWHKTGELLAKKKHDMVSMMDKLNVKVVCTMEDPASDLEWHLRCAYSEHIPFAVLPTFVPDRFIDIENTAWFSAITELGARYGVVHDWESLKAALGSALDAFCDAGCKLVLRETQVEYNNDDPTEIIEKAIHQGAVSREEAEIYKGALNAFLSEEYEKRRLMVTDDPRWGGVIDVEYGVRSIANQIDMLMETGKLSGSVSMLTGACSVTSFVRHEYYRRILCEKIGLLVESGQYPNDLEFLGEMVQDICWKNAVEYFDFEL